MTAPTASDFGDHAWAHSAAFRELLEDERRDADKAVAAIRFRDATCGVCRKLVAYDDIFRHAEKCGRVSSRARLHIALDVASAMLEQPGDRCWDCGETWPCGCPVVDVAVDGSPK